MGGGRLGERRLLGLGLHLLPTGACGQKAWAIHSWGPWAVPGREGLYWGQGHGGLGWESQA